MAIQNKFNPNLPHTAVAYLRYSHKRQNKDSSEHQLAEIERNIKRLGLPWKIVKVYRDDGISGRRESSRPGYQQMLHDIETGAVKPSLIVVDTIERFSRGRKREHVRQELQDTYGVLVVAANNNFSDPSTSIGRVESALKDYQSGEENQTKAHNVLRGKRGVVKQKKWPGGPAPFGFLLERLFEEKNGQMEHAGSRLIQDPNAVPTVRLLFEEAKRTGFGQTRLAARMNSHPDVPEVFKPMLHSTIGRMLNNTLYKGVFIFCKGSTDIINDHRVYYQNDPDDFLYVSDYCEPIVSPELWDEVNELRNERRKNTPSKKKRPEGAVPALGRGIALKYPLTGLVYCEKCGNRMSPSSCGEYTKKTGDQAGEAVRYVSYVCSGARDKSCSNNCSVKESWLLDVVLNLIRQRLFSDDSEDNADRQWLQELMTEVNAKLDQLSSIPNDRCKALEAEQDDLGKKIAGWQMTLGDPELPQAIRNDITKRYQTAAERRDEIENLLWDIDNHKKRLANAVPEEDVQGRLDRLSSILVDESPTRLNLELSLIIDSITVFQDGRIVVKMCKLGLISNVVSLVDFTRSPDLDPADSCGPPDRRRRRPKLAIDTLTGPKELESMERFAADAHRFDGLDDEWFWFDEFRQPEPTCWSKEHAAEVAEMRATGMTHESLAEYFGVTVPTIRKALKHAAEADPTIRQLPRKMPRARWHEDHALEVAALAAKGMSTAELAEHFGKSDPTILKAKKHVAMLEAASSPEKRKPS